MYDFGLIEIVVGLAATIFIVGLHWGVSRSKLLDIEKQLYEEKRKTDMDVRQMRDQLHAHIAESKNTSERIARIEERTKNIQDSLLEIKKFMKNDRRN